MRGRGRRRRQVDGSSWPNVCNNIFYALEWRRIRFVCIKLSLGWGGHTVTTVTAAYGLVLRVLVGSGEPSCKYKVSRKPTSHRFPQTHTHANRHSHLAFAKTCLLQFNLTIGAHKSQPKPPATSQPSNRTKPPFRVPSHSHRDTGAHKGAESRKVDYKMPAIRLGLYTFPGRMLKNIRR